MKKKGNKEKKIKRKRMREMEGTAINAVDSKEVRSDYGLHLERKC